MAGFVGKLEALTLKNKYFRKVLFTGKHSQLVLMCLQPGEEIGNEVHKTVDQFFRIEEGSAKFVFNGKEIHLVHANDGVIVPAGTYHNVINTSKTNPLKLYTVYSPPTRMGRSIRPKLMRLKLKNTSITNSSAYQHPGTIRCPGALVSGRPDPG